MKECSKVLVVFLASRVIGLKCHKYTLNIYVYIYSKLVINYFNLIYIYIW